MVRRLRVYARFFNSILGERILREILKRRENGEKTERLRIASYAVRKVLIRFIRIY